MNEQRHSKRLYFNPQVSDAKCTTEELWAEISSFVHKNNLKVADVVFLNTMLSQLKKPNNNISKKVLRSMDMKFRKIRDSYQR